MLPRHKSTIWENLTTLIRNFQIQMLKNPSFILEFLITAHQQKSLHYSCLKQEKLCVISHFLITLLMKGFELPSNHLWTYRQRWTRIFAQEDGGFCQCIFVLCLHLLCQRCWDRTFFEYLREPLSMHIFTAPPSARIPNS